MSGADPRSAAARAVNLAVTRRACPGARAIDGGWLVAHAGLPDVHHLNAVHLRDAPANPAALARLADGLQPGLGHRRVVIDDADGAERLADALLADGWERDRLLFMAFEGIPGAPDPRARELDEVGMQALQRAVLAGEDWGPYAAPGLVDRLADAQAALRAATPSRRFGAGTDDRLSAMATLFCDPDLDGRRVAMLESVGTLRADRGQGLAQAVCTAAVHAARDWAADELVVPVDADDWPQLMYAGLGVVALGRAVGFTRRV